MDESGDRTDKELDERLLGELRARGIAYLAGGHDAVSEAAVRPMPDAELLHALARYPDSRVRNAVVGLLLLHPEVADALPHALRESDKPTAQSLATLALAALYMSHLWRTRLRLALGHATDLPEHLLTPLIAARGLPAADEFYGELGLRALADYERTRRGVRYNFVSDWQNQVEQLIAHERLRRHAAERAQAPA